MSKSPEIPNSYNYPPENVCEEIRLRLFTVFNNHLNEFLSDRFPEKLLIQLNFVPTNYGIITFANGDNLLFIPSGDIRKRFHGRLSQEKKTDLPSITYKNYVTVDDSERISHGLKPLSNTRLWLVTTMNPIIQNNREGIAVFQESYHDPIAREQQDPKVELWIAKRVNLSTNHLNPNTDKRITVSRNK
jgi:hypothetical protein